MKRFISYFVVFILGFGVCAWVLNYFYGPPGEFARSQVVDRPRGGLNLATSNANRVTQAADIVSDYVVNIDTIGKPVVVYGPGPGFPDFFGFGEPRRRVPRGIGSGVVFRPNGYILTNNHVVEGAEQFTVTLHSEKKYPARLVGRDPMTDLAVLKIDASGLEYGKFSNSNTLDVGDWVVAVGNALGLGPTVTIGVVSAKRVSFELDGKIFESMIQTDAAINQGNSGGALADLNGDIVGINTAIAGTLPGEGNIGIGFAIPSNTARRIADELVARGKVVHPWVGIRYGPYNEDRRKILKARGVTDLPNEDGAEVGEVVAGSPAQEAGFKAGDIILKVNGKPLSGTLRPQGGKTTVAAEITRAKVGDLVKFEVWHPHTRRKGTIAVRIGEMPADFAQQP